MTKSMTAESRSELGILNLGKLRSANLRTDPYDYLVVSGFIKPEWEDRLISDYPSIKKGGSFPLW